MKYVEEIYYNTIDMVINTRTLLKNIFAEVEDIEEKSWPVSTIFPLWEVLIIL